MKERNQNRNSKQWASILLFCAFPCIAIGSVTISPDASTSICPGAATTLTANCTPTPPSYSCPCDPSTGEPGSVIQNASAPPQYDWTGATSSGGATAQLNTSSAGSQQVTVTVTTYWVCTTDPTADIAPTTDTTTVTYTIEPALTFGTNGGEICSGATLEVGPGSGGSGTGFTFSSSNTSCASVNSSTGLVTGNSRGTATITLTDSNGCTATTTVTVNVVVIAGPTTVGVGGSIQLSASGQSATWTSSNTSIATVNSSSGLVTGVALGNVTITATVNGCVGTYGVSVVPTPPSPVTVSSNKVFLQLNATPADQTTFTASGGSGGYTFNSSDTTVASIDSTSGVASPVATGTTSITATDSSGTVSSPVTLTVYTINIKNIATFPNNRSRSIIGVGELVSFSTTPAVTGTWGINVATTGTSSLGSSINSTSGDYTGGYSGGTETVNITSSTGGLNGSVSVTLLIPNGYAYVGANGSGATPVDLIHEQNYCNAGFGGRFNLTATSAVSFFWTYIKEDAFVFSTAGPYFSRYNGTTFPAGTNIPTMNIQANIIQGVDNVYSSEDTSYPSLHPFPTVICTLQPSSATQFGVPTDYATCNTSGTLTSSFYLFYDATTLFSTKADGSGRCYATKSGTTKAFSPSDPTVGTSYGDF